MGQSENGAQRFEAMLQENSKARNRITSHLSSPSSAFKNRDLMLASSWDIQTSCSVVKVI